MRISKFLTTPLMSAVLAALASAGVDVLGKPQLGTFATIQEAIDAASEGDVLIVEDGIYPGFTITNKSLCVIGATGALVEVQGTCTIRNLGPARRASLVGVSATAFQNANGVARPGLELLDNLGSVRLQNCTFTGAKPQFQPGSSTPPSGSGADVTRSAKVLFTRCMLFGRSVGMWSGEVPRAAGAGLNSLDSAVALYECVARGGEGSVESYPSGGEGGPGCRVSGWGVFASGSSIEGGRGGGGDYIGCTSSGDGGDGLVITDGQAQLYDTAIVRGAAGSFFTCTPGVGGQRVVASAAVVNEFDTRHRSLGGPRYVNDNSQTSFQFTGRPGDTVFLLVGSQPVFTYMAGSAGISTIRQPWVPLPVGVVGPSGSLNIPYTLPDITSPQAGFPRYFQALAINGQQQFLSTPIQVLVINT